ncbi:hypothetical protein VTO73DRAFT_5419 [Trametes versicolor]
MTFRFLANFVVSATCAVPERKHFSSPDAQGVRMHGTSLCADTCHRTARPAVSVLPVVSASGHCCVLPDSRSSALQRSRKVLRNPPSSPPGVDVAPRSEPSHEYRKLSISENGPCQTRPIRIPARYIASLEDGSSRVPNKNRRAALVNIPDACDVDARILCSTAESISRSAAK